MEQNLAKEISDAITSEVIERTLGVSEHSVRAARTAGRFPASWFEQMHILCLDAGISCPFAAFNWKPSVQTDCAENPTNVREISGEIVPCVG